MQTKREGKSPYNDSRLKTNQNITFNSFLNTFENELIENIKTLYSGTVKIVYKDIIPLELFQLEKEYIATSITVQNNDNYSNIFSIISPTFSKILTKLMIDEKLEGNMIITDLSMLDNDDYDALQEIYENIIGSTKTTLNIDRDENKIELFLLGERKEHIAPFWNNNIEDLNNGKLFKNVISYKININEKIYDMFLIIPIDFENKILNKHTQNKINIASYGVDENLFNDIKVPISVRFKTSLLPNDKNELLDSEILESLHLSYEPVIICANNLPIGEGKVIIVDGNFGVQITKLYTEAEASKLIINEVLQ